MPKGFLFSHRGGRSEQADCIVVGGDVCIGHLIKEEIYENPMFFAVVDAMGGEDKENFSKEICCHLVDRLKTVDKFSEDCIRSLIFDMHISISKNYDSVGAAIVLAVLKNTDLYVASIGDSVVAVSAGVEFRPLFQMDQQHPGVLAKGIGSLFIDKIMKNDISTGVYSGFSHGNKLLMMSDGFYNALRVSDFSGLCYEDFWEFSSSLLFVDNSSLIYYEC
ncbi:protein phosphatase 2C domain-containing protein [Desulfocurvus sp. DL9XJH121]